MPRKNSNVKRRHIDAATYYLAGESDTRGKWRASCVKAGFSRAPDKRSKVMQAALAIVRDKGDDVDDTQRELADLLSNDKASWDEMAPVARAMLAKIGAGFVEATTGQVSALKEIIARNEGRVGSEPQKDKPIGVVVLPALGSLSEAMVDAPPVGEPVIGERHNRAARRSARKGEWEKARTIPGGGYRDEEHGGRS